jgi:hypothetical protein
LAENERTEQGKCNGTATLLANKKNKLFQSSVPFTKKKKERRKKKISIRKKIYASSSRFLTITSYVSACMNDIWI